MTYLKPYKRINRLIENETFEPMISWGIRMAISAMVPLIWGLATGNIKNAIWIILPAECLCWVELKGSFAWQVRTLAAGAVLAMAFAMLGSLVGNVVWLSVLCMFVVGFLASVLRNLGDRASGLSICVFLLYIFCAAYPVTNAAEAKERLFYVFIGTMWPIVVGMSTSLLAPTQRPFRRQIALVWKSISSLVAVITKGWEVNDLRSNIRDIYLREKDVRDALDNSFQFYTSMAYQLTEKDDQYQLTQLRKTTSLVATHIVAISEEMENIKISELDKSLRTKLSSLFSALSQTIDRMAIYVIVLKAEEELLVISNLNRLKKLIGLIKQYPKSGKEKLDKSIIRLIVLTERAVKLVENALTKLEHQKKDKPVYRSYSLAKTLIILNPKQVLRNLQFLANFNTYTNRFALRTAIAAAIAFFIYKWFRNDHGYWLPFSVMIVMQPYFGATFKKAIDRVVGTLLGGLAGSVFLRFPAFLHIKEIMLFITFVLMVFYLRKNYAVSAFVVTLNLVLLFNIELALNPMLIVTRALCTVGGAGLAVIAGFALLPTWDRKWLPIHFAEAVRCNYEYFIYTFYKPTKDNWTRNKKSVETKNSNVFDSFNRYVAEPSARKQPGLYYDLITYNVRITRDLNNIHLEQDERTDKDVVALPATQPQQVQINECLLWFNKNLQSLSSVDPGITKSAIEYRDGYFSPFKLSNNQVLYVEKLLIELKTMNQDIEKLVEKEHAM